MGSIEKHTLRSSSAETGSPTSQHRFRPNSIPRSGCRSVRRKPPYPDDRESNLALLETHAERPLPQSSVSDRTTGLIGSPPAPTTKPGSNTSPCRSPRADRTSILTDPTTASAPSMETARPPSHPQPQTAADSSAHPSSTVSRAHSHRGLAVSSQAQTRTLQNTGSCRSPDE